jgi:hypothetical protein
MIDLLKLVYHHVVHEGEEITSESAQESTYN